jgi:glycosyltransferase involved in cell wall biosynthesis
VDTSRFHPASGNSKASGGEDWFVVGSVGRVETVKDYPTLVRAFAMARGRLGGGARLRVVGDGSQRETVQRSMISEGVADIAEITGTRSDVPEMLRQFDVFVLPSLAEGISNTILEAMATGLPVIATAVGGNAELVVDGETGFLVGPGDAQAIAERLVRYRDAPELAARHGRAARDRVAGQFSLDTMVQAYADLYRSSVTAGSA